MNKNNTHFCSYLIRHTVLTNIVITLFVAWLLLGSSQGFAQSVNPKPNRGSCNTELLEQYEADFDKLIAQQTALGISNNRRIKRDMSTIASKYIAMNAACFEQLYQDGFDKNGSELLYIDDGGVRMVEIAPGELQVSNFTLGRTKWGANSPFVNSLDDRRNIIGPRSPGGLVTYSFMPSGVSNQVEVDFGFTSSINNNVPISSLPTFSNCFIDEIVRGFAMWSAVANIQFQQVSDNGTASNGQGATGDIRIGAHSFDGPSRTLAHAFFPPTSNSSSITISGDLHFDQAEQWTCDTSGLDIGIVATHEIGHSIGLDHEEGPGSALAIMNPFYNPDLPSLTTDDILAAQSVYGPANGFAFLAAQSSRAVVTFLDDDLPLVIPLTPPDPILQVPDECIQRVGTNPNGVNFVDNLVSSCASVNRPVNSFAQYYEFELSSARSITISMFSPAFDTFVLLLNEQGNVIAANDDGASQLNSTIERTLTAGRYLIEASSFSSLQTGSFTLDIR